jgi:uncharacterized RmlC-like cupin family protein
MQLWPADAKVRLRAHAIRGRAPGCGACQTRIRTVCSSLLLALQHLLSLPAANKNESKAMSGSHHDHHHHPHHHDDDHAHDPDRWKHDGVRVIPGNQLDPNVPSTKGMDRKAAINFARVGAQKLWAGTVTIHANAKTGAHHHGHLESIIFVVKGKARMRWGERLQFTAEAGPGDFIFVPPYVPHQEINASPDEVLECVLVRSDGEAVAINLDIEPVEKPENVPWVDPIHRG